MGADGGAKFGLWVLTVAMAVLGGVASTWAGRVRRREPRSEEAARSSDRWMLVAYVFMSISILGFAAQGLL